MFTWEDGPLCSTNRDYSSALIMKYKTSIFNLPFTSSSCIHYQSPSLSSLPSHISIIFLVSSCCSALFMIDCTLRQNPQCYLGVHCKYSFGDAVYFPIDLIPHGAILLMVWVVYHWDCSFCGKYCAYTFSPDQHCDRAVDLIFLQVILRSNSSSITVLSTINPLLSIIVRRRRRTPVP